MRSPIILIILLGLGQQIAAQDYVASIESCNCLTKVDPSLISRCGYLVVPENRQKPTGRRIKIPFVYVRKQGADSVKNVTLYTTGGPGYSTIANIDSIRGNSDFLQFGGFIAFDQRGTKKALPCLDCPEVDAAIKRSYKEGLSKDSLEWEAVRRCRKRLMHEGTDLSAYNTIESAADINDLRKLLHIDSLNLFGISYSGGLMLTVAGNHPEAVRTLILNSPLPGYVNYEEHALFNHEEALNQVFANCEADSTGPQYAQLRDRFHRYFTSITGRRFTIRYVEKGGVDTLAIQYTKQELMDAIIDRLTTYGLRSVPFVINELINGNHAVYVKEQLDNIFSGNKTLSRGMRYSIYCSEQIAYADRSLVKKQEEMMPWYEGYSFNNVDHPVCDCWKVKPEPAVVKVPVYSKVPALIAAGDADPWCRLFYNRLIRRTMPNAQLMTVHNNGHGARFYVEGIDFLKMFMADPYKKLVSPVKNVVIE